MRMTESDLVELIKKVLKEQTSKECYTLGRSLFDEATETVVCVGETGNRIKLIQGVLNSLKCCGDCLPIKEDGVFGPETKERLLHSKKTCFKKLELKNGI